MKAINNKLIVLTSLLLWVGILSAQTPLSLEECRNRALEHNHKMQISRANVDAARNLKKASQTQFLPSFSATGSYTRINQTFNFSENLHLGEILQGMADANPGIVSDPFYATLSGMAAQGYLPDELELQRGEKDNYVFTAQMIQPVFMGGKIHQQYQITKAVESSAEQNLKLTRTEILVQTDEAYWRVNSLTEKVKLAHSYRDMVAKHVGDLNNAYEVGIATQNDVLKATVKLNEAELSVLKAENGLKLSQMALNQIIGNDILAEVTTVDKSDSLIVVAQEDTTAFLELRPELQMLRQNIRINESLVGIARSAYMPNIVLQANAHMINPNPYKNLDPEFGSDWQVGLLAEFELFHFNERGQRYRAAKQAANIANMQYQEATEMINLEVHQAYYKYTEAIKQVQMTANSVKQAAENLRVTQDRFDEGMARSSDLLDAQTLWQNSYSAWIDAKNEQNLKASEYQKALGTL